MKKVILPKLDVTNKGYRNVLVVSYVVLSLISVAFLLLSMFSWFRSYLDEEMADMSLLQLNNTSRIVNSKFNTYQMLLQNMFQEPSVKSALYSDATDPGIEFEISRYVNSVIINDGSLDYAVIFNNGKIRQIIGPVYPEIEEQNLVLEYLNQSVNDKNLFFVKNDNSLKDRFFVFRTERDVFGESPKRGIVFAINQNKLSRSMFSSDKDNNNFFVFDSDSNLVVQQGVYSDMLHKKVWSYISEDSSDVASEIDFNGNNFYLVSIISSEYDLRFVQLIDVGDINSTLSEVLKVSLISVLAIIIISTFVAILLAHFIFYPLRSFIKSLVANTDLQMDNIDDNEHITRLTSERIISEISTISRQFHSDKVLSYLEDAPSDSTPPRFLRINQTSEWIILLFVGSKTGKVSLEQQQELSCNLTVALGESITVRAFADENSPYSVIVVKGSKTAELRFLIYTENVKEYINNSIDEGNSSKGPIYVFYSEVLNREEQLQQTFKQLKTISKYILFEECDITNSVENFTSKLDEEIPKKEFQPILAAVKKADDFEAKRLMADLLKDIKQYEIKRIFHALSLFASELDDIQNQLTAGSYKSQEAYLNHYIKMTSLINKKELQDYLSNIIEDVCLEVRTYSERSLRTNMIESIQYIREHYTDPGISVDQIAGSFHISTSYFSRMFNEICQSSFPEYVNDLRLNFSAQLIRDTELSVKDVSAKSGFSSVSYFSAQFKRKYGVSPSTYRKNMTPKT